MINYIIFNKNKKLIQTGNCISESYIPKIFDDQITIKTKKIIELLDNQTLEYNEEENDFTIVELQNKTNENTIESKWEEVRLLRNLIIKDSDWTQLEDIPIEIKLKWRNYRQLLRDITNQLDPFNINWPVAPDDPSNTNNPTD